MKLVTVWRENVLTSICAPAQKLTSDNRSRVACASEMVELAATVAAIHSDSLDSAKVSTKLVASLDRLAALDTWLRTTYPVA